MKRINQAVALTVGAVISMSGASLADTTFLQSADKDQWLASELIGSYVYANTQEDAEAIGDVNNLLLDGDGNMIGVIVGVGGFLGVGEKNVAVDFSQLSYSDTGADDVRIVLDVDKTALESAPEFERNEGDAYRLDEGQWGDAYRLNEDDRQSDAGAVTDPEASVDPLAEDEEQMAESADEASDDAEQVADNAAQTADEATDEMAETADEAADDAEQVADNAAETADEATDEMAETADEIERDSIGDESVAMDAAPEDEPVEMTSDDQIETGGETDEQIAENAAPQTGERVFESTELVGHRVYTQAEEDWIGEVNDVLLDESGNVDAVVIDFGGFLGIGEKPIALSLDALELRQDDGSTDDADFTVYTTLTNEELESAPTYDADSFEAERDMMLVTGKG